MVAPADQPVIGFDVGGSFIRVGVSPRSGVVTEVARVATPADDWSAFASALQDLSRKAQRQSVSRSACHALAIAGVVRPNGTLAASNIPALHGRPAGELTALFDAPVVLANDADCFTLAEAVAGQGQGHGVVFGAILGSGVGGGLVVDRQPVIEGGEWGHGPILSTLPVGTPPVSVPRFPCPCGQIGCSDTVGGARGIERLHHYLHKRALSSRAILDAWRAGEPDGRQTVSAYVDLLAEPLALVINVTRASIVCAGGGLARDGVLVDALDRAVRQRILSDPGRPLIVQARHLDDGGLLGAAEWARLPAM